MAQRFRENFRGDNFEFVREQPLFNEQNGVARGSKVTVR
jgi:hypothetical protein